MYSLFLSFALTTLRVCADPNNLPFSAEHTQGFENKIMALVAQELNAKVEYVWWAERRNFVRNTLLAGRCDVLPGLPAGSGSVLTTRPYFRSTYVFVTRRDKGLHIKSLYDPKLSKLRIGVHVLGENFAPPAHALAVQGIRDNIKGFDMFPPQNLLKAVENGEIDVAIAWGPLAGYFAKHLPKPLDLVAVKPEREGVVPFAYSISMAVRKDNAALKEKLDRALTKRRSEIRQILTTYGVPLATEPASLPAAGE